MAVKFWRGDAPAVAQKTRVRITSGTVAEGTDVRFTINGKTVEAESTEDTYESLIVAGAAAWNASEIPEFAEVTATAVEDANGDWYIDLVADTPGKPFTFSITGPYPTIDVDKIADYTVGTNEVQKFWFVAPVPTSGTYEIDWDLGAGTESSDPIAYNANADAVKDAMVSGMASLSDGDITVTGAGTAGNPFVVSATSTGNFAGQNLNQLSLDTALLSTTASVDISVTQSPGTNTNEIHLMWWQLAPGSEGAGTTAGLSQDRETTFASVPLWNPAKGDRQTNTEALIAENLGVDVIVRLWQNNYQALLSIEWLDGETHDLLYGEAVDGAGNPAGDAVVRRAQTGGSGTKNHFVVMMTPMSYPEYVSSPGLIEDSQSTFTHDGNSAAKSGTWLSTGITYTTAADIEDVSSIGAANCSFHTYGRNGVGSGDISTVYENFLLVVEFDGSLAGDSQNVTYSSAAAGLTGNSGYYGVYPLSEGAAAPNEIQKVVVYGDGGSWDVDWADSGAGAQTVTIAGGEASFTTALDALVGSGDYILTGSGTAADPWFVEFIDVHAQTDVAILTAAVGSLTKSVESTVQTATPGVAGDPDIFLVTITGATGGTFTLSFRDKETTSIAYNASAATVQSAIVALDSVGTGNFTVTGSAGGPWTLTAANALAGQSLPKFESENSSLTGTGQPTFSSTEIIASTGPHHADEPLNYSGGTLPVNGDTLIFTDNDVDCLYGLDGLSGVTLASLQATASFTGNIGLARFDVDGEKYYQYRDRNLQVGATEVIVGSGEGGGSSRINLDLEASSATVNVLNTSSPEGEWYKSLVLYGSGITAINVLKGSVDLCPDPGQTSTCTNIKLAYIDSVSSDVDFRVGSGATVTNIDMVGGTCDINCATTLLTAREGYIILNDGGDQTSIVMQNSTLDWRTTDEVTNLSARDSIVDLSRDPRAKDFNASNVIELYGQTELRDPLGVLPDGVAIRKNIGTEIIVMPSGRTYTVTV